MYILLAGQQNQICPAVSEIISFRRTDILMDKTMDEKYEKQKSLHLYNEILVEKFGRNWFVQSNQIFIPKVLVHDKSPI